MEELARVLAGRRVVALTGAGISTDSGIPDYRGSGRVMRTPIQHLDFVRSAAVRRRYWARAFVGWERFGRARPNDAHLALRRLEDRGVVSGIITQNVDRLHHAACSERVIELHGALAEVRCLACGAIEERGQVQQRLQESNPGFEASAAMAPDGDAELSAEQIDGFTPVGCHACGGDLKPNVVFFGDNVARPVVEAAFAMLEQAEALLVLGTSLTVFSGFRFVRRAHERSMPIAIVNLGPTRGDPFAAARVDAPLGAALAQLERLL